MVARVPLAQIRENTGGGSRIGFTSGEAHRRAAASSRPQWTCSSGRGYRIFPQAQNNRRGGISPVAVSTERQCVSVPVEPIYLVIQDTALRSSLTAWLGLAGHSIVALQDLTTLIASRPAATGLFVIEANLLPESREDWIGILEPILPCDRCIVLIPGEGGQHGPLMLADRRGSLVVIQKAIARLEGLQLVG
jgi:hypothetical protein